MTLATKATLIVFTLAATACGNAANDTPSAVKDDQPAPARTSLCEVYASSTQNIDFYKVVDPTTDALSPSEEAMIQTAVIVGGMEDALTPDEAIDIFTDRENGGDLGGNISYAKLLVNGNEQVLARVTYYPGDNEYGALFRIWSYQDGRTQHTFIGTVGDRDVYCLTYRN